MPATAAGYSGTQLARKLGLKEAWRLALVGAPDEFGPELDPMPDGVTVTRTPDTGSGPIDIDAGAGVDLALLFVTQRHDLARLFPQVGRRLPPAGALWVAWPKRTSGRATDVTENVLREVCLPLGWVDTKVCAITDVWSGLKFVLRKENRPSA